MHRSFLTRFIRRNDGAATVETVLWFPFFIAVFGLMFDTTMLFHTQAKIMRAIQDGNRTYSVGKLSTTSATETYIEDKLAGINVTAHASSQVTAGVMTTTVRVRASELDLLGFFTAIRNVEFTVSAYHMVENWET